MSTITTTTTAATEAATATTATPEAAKATTEAATTTTTAATEAATATPEAATTTTTAATEAATATPEAAKATTEAATTTTTATTEAATTTMTMDVITSNKDLTNLEVKIVSNEILKPTTPTPLERQKYTLNFFDQTFAPIHCQMILFYPNMNNNNPTQKQPIDTNILKKSLCDTLACYYPLAGRCESESVILCEDQGVPFVVTNVNCNLSDVTKSPNKMDLYPKFMPPKEEGYDVNKWRKISDLILISFQINLFECGGVAIGCECLHKIVDMAALSNFFIYWATTVAAGKTEALPAATAEKLAEFMPDLESSLKMFPPSLDVQRMLGVPPLKYMMGLNQTVRVVGRSFVFSKDAISTLRTLATSEGLPTPTRFEAVGGFVWEHALGVSQATGNQVTTTVMTIFADLRARTSPPLPKTAFGNLVTHTTARTDTIKEDGEVLGLTSLAFEIHEALSKLKRSSVEELQDRGSPDDMRYKPGCFKLSSWCKLGLMEADFGFGKPWIVPTNGLIYPMQRNFVYFADDLTGTGIEVWLLLEENEMKILESSPEFLKFAIPN